MTMPSTPTAMAMSSFHAIAATSNSQYAVHRRREAMR